MVGISHLILPNFCAYLFYRPSATSSLWQQVPYPCWYLTVVIHISLSLENVRLAITMIIIWRSSRPEVFCEKGLLRKFAKFTGKHLCQSLFFNKVAGPNFIKKETLAQVVPL